MNCRNTAKPHKIHTHNTSDHPVLRHRGFTTIEVLMVLVLTAIVSALALPSYTNMIERRLLIKNTEQIAAFLNSVDSIANMTNQVITISYERGGHRNWCFGAAVDSSPESTAGDCDCTETSPSASDYCAIDGQRYVFDNDDTNDMRLMHRMTGDGAFSFDPVRGVLWDLDDSLQLHLHADSSDFDLILNVRNTGKVTMCSRSNHEYVIGYEVCD